MLKFLDPSAKPRLISSIIPVVYGVIYLILGIWRGPYYWWGNSDPDYAYLTNSLGLLLGEVPKHTDHPGTPLQLVGAAVIGIIHILDNLDAPFKGITVHVLKHPETYLSAIGFALIGIIAVALWQLGLAMLRFSQSWILMALVQISPLLCIATIAGNEQSRVSPDILIIAVSQVLAVVLLRYLYDDQSRPLQFALSLGAVLGLGLAVKVTFLPMLLFLLLLRGWQQRGLALGAIILSFVVATLPIVSRYIKTVKWMSSVALSTGIYNGGTKDGVFFNTSHWVEDARVLIEGMIGSLDTGRFGNCVFFTVLAIASLVAFLAWGKVFKSTQQSSLFDQRVKMVLSLLVIAGWVQTAMTINEIPESRYLNPTVGLIGFAIALCMMLGTSWIKSIGFRHIEAFVLGICCTVSLQQGLVSGQYIQQIKGIYQGEVKAVKAIVTQQEHQHCTLVYYQRTSSVEGALKLAALWTPRQLLNPMQRSHPHTVFYISHRVGYQNFVQTRGNRGNSMSEGLACKLLWRSNSVPDSEDARALDLLQDVKAVLYRGRIERLYLMK